MPSYLHTSGALLRALRDQAGLIGVLAFYLGASMYYYVFYRFRLIPRWLSGWGLTGTALGTFAGLLVLFRVTDYMSTTQIALNVPIGVNEMVLAIWLLVRGFDSRPPRPHRSDGRREVTEASDPAATFQRLRRPARRSEAGSDGRQWDRRGFAGRVRCCPGPRRDRSCRGMDESDLHNRPGGVGRAGGPRAPRHRPPPGRRWRGVDACESRRRECGRWLPDRGVAFCRSLALQYAPCPTGESVDAVLGRRLPLAPTTSTFVRP